ncbi:MAG: CvpA family protein [Saprospiraceae bacterium]|nr:CvpA family protein [Saprospiraceae bacterium]
MTIDVFCVAIFMFGFWHGYSRGIIHTIFNLLTWLFGITLAFKMAPVMRNILQTIFDTDTDLMIVVAFGINLAFVFFIMRAIANGISGVLKIAFLGIFNRAMGGVATGMFYVLIFSILLYFVNMANALNEATLKESRTFPFLKDMPPKTWALIKRFQPMAKEMFNDSSSWMDRLKDEGIQRTEAKQKTYRPPDNGAGIEDEPVTGARRPVDESSGIEEDE